MTSVFYSRNLFKTKSKYSETRIYDFIYKFLGKLPSVRQLNASNNDNDDCVCIECLGKIDEYDLATITARRVETELRDLLLHAESSIYRETKDAAGGGNDDHFVTPIETVEMLDQFKVEKSCNESNEPRDFVESILADDYDESLASDSDDEYVPPDSLIKQMHRTVNKTKRKTATNERKQPHRTNRLLDQQRNVKCAECDVEFKRYFLLKFEVST